MKVSIIVPVYNVEKYLDQCIESVLAQRYQDYELILVDDGSTDSSGELCDAWKSRRENIRVIHKENGGLSDARNTGMEAAEGMYIMFLDSDDYWENAECLGILAKKAAERELDILNFRYKKFLEEEEKYFECLPSFDETIVDALPGKNEVLECLLQQGLYLSSACNKMLRTDFVKEHKLYFKKGITSEDIDWCARCMIAAEKIGYSNLSCYVYRQRTGSISHSVSYRNIYDLKNNINECIRLGDEINPQSMFWKIYFTFVAYQYGTFLYSNNLVQDPRVGELVEEMKQHRWLLQYHSNKKIKMLYYLDKFFGYYNMIRCMKLYGKIRKG